jgi:hypothetical protein
MKKNKFDSQGGQSLDAEGPVILWGNRGRNHFAVCAIISVPQRSQALRRMLTNLDGIKSFALFLRQTTFGRA